MAKEDDNCWDIDEILRNDDCGSHEDFEILLLHASRFVECKPGRVEQRAPSAVSIILRPESEVRTLCHTAMSDRLLTEDSPVPNMASRRSTILTRANALLFPSNVAVPQNLHA